MDRFAGYEVLKLLGKGTSGRVFQCAEDTAGGKQLVAIKIIDLPEDDQEDYLRRFRREARLGTRLKARNIVQILGSGQIDDQCYLVMEFVDGVNLLKLFRSVERGRPLSPQACGLVIRELAHGLHFAHELVEEGEAHPVIHRDLKPANVMVSFKGEVQLTDFGVAKVADATTDSGGGAGTYAYMPLEQMLGYSDSPTLDLFALGVILHELLSGERLRPKNDPAGCLAHARAGVIPDLTRDDVPPELDALRRKLLAKDPADRPASALLVRQALDRIPGIAAAVDELAAAASRAGGVAGARSTVDAIAAPSTGGTTVRGDGTDRAGVSPALVFGMLGAVAALAGGGGYFLARSEPAAEAPAVAAGVEPVSVPEPVAAPEPEPVEVPEAEPEPEPVEVPEAAPVAAEEPVRKPVRKRRKKPKASADGPAPAAKKQPGQEPKADTTSKVRVKVRMVLGDGARLCYVRVDHGPIFSLEPYADGKLPPGKHRIHWRLMPDDPWKDGGTIELKAGKSYKLRCTPTGPGLMEE